MFYFFQGEDGPFVWTKTAQGHVLGAFFYGYLVSQVPAGMLAEHVGGKWVFTGVMALTAIPTLLTPPAAKISYKMLIVLRVLAGIGSVRSNALIGAIQVLRNIFFWKLDIPAPICKANIVGPYTFLTLI